MRRGAGWLKAPTKFPRYPLCVISRRASSRPARASHAAAAASAVGCAHAARGVDCAAREPCRRRGFDRNHVGTRHGVPPGRTDHRPTSARHQLFVFLAPEVPRIGGGGGGGGNRQPGPIRRAQGIGSDSMTLRVQKGPSPTAAPVRPASAPAVEEVPPLPSIVLEAKPLASGLFDQIGLPTGGVMSGTSTGPGSGGGVGTGIGTGIGSGRGPGLGPGSGGGTGGGVYRPGGAVSAPRLIKEVKPKSTERGARKENSRHGCAGSHRHRRRMRVANPCRAFAGRRGPR